MLVLSSLLCRFHGRGRTHQHGKDGEAEADVDSGPEGEENLAISAKSRTGSENTEGRVAGARQAQEAMR